MANMIAEGSSPVIEQPALSFQVYEPGVAPPRTTVRPTAEAVPASKMSLGVRVCLFLVGLCVVVGTASAIVAVSTDDPPSKAPAVTGPAAHPPPVLVSTGTLPLTDPNAPPIVAAPAVAPSIVIDPAPTGTPTPTVGATPASAKKPVAPTPAPKGSAPPQVRGAAPPPNPYATPGKK